MRRFAIVDVDSRFLGPALQSAQFRMHGVLESDGRLCDCIPALPANPRLVYADIETGGVYSREGTAQDFHGNLMDLTGFSGIAQAYVGQTAVTVTIKSGTVALAERSLDAALTLGIGAISVGLKHRAAFTMSRPEMIATLLAALRIVAETNDADRTIATIFSAIEVYDPMMAD